MGKHIAPPLGQYVHGLLFVLVLTLVSACGGSVQQAKAAPYATHVMDARTGETLAGEDSNRKLHPASLTKMLTLYIAFEEIERGNLSLDSIVTVSKNAAAQPPSRLGLKAGQKIALRYLIRAAAVKSANDAAQAIGDHIGGDQAGFAQRMNRTARALGMKNSTFKNANGLTAKGHLSTPHDMSILGRHLFYDFPQYYNIFSRRSTDAGLAEVANTNRRFLDAYKGADGIKTGYTDAAGFNLTASAERNGVRIIATVFGGKSTADRNAKVARLLDMGFARAPANAATVPPKALPSADDEMIVSQTDEALPEVEGGAGKTVRIVVAVNSSPRPVARPELGEEAEVVVAGMEDSINAALAEATAAPPPDGTLEAQAVAIADGSSAEPETNEAVQLALAEVETAPEVEAPKALTMTAEVARVKPITLVELAPVPKKRAKKAPIYDSTTAEVASAEAPSEDIVLAKAEEAPVPLMVVSRLSSSSAKHWGINLGTFGDQYAAQKVLTKTQLAQSGILGDSLRKIAKTSKGFDATFLGLTQEQAEVACARLTARNKTCSAFGP